MESKKCQEMKADEKKTVESCQSAKAPNTKETEKKNHGQEHPYDFHFTVFATMFAASLVLDLVEQWLNTTVIIIIQGMNN